MVDGEKKNFQTETYFTRFSCEILSSMHSFVQNHCCEILEVCLIRWVNNTAVVFLLVHNNNTNAIQKIDESAAQMTTNTCTLLTDATNLPQLAQRSEISSQWWITVHLNITFFFFKLAHSWNKWCCVIRGCIPTQTRKTQEDLINFCIVFQNDKQYIGRASKYRGYSAEQRLSTFWTLSSTVGTEGWISHRFQEVPHLDEYATTAGEPLYFLFFNQISHVYMFYW